MFVYCLMHVVASRLSLCFSVSHITYVQLTLWPPFRVPLLLASLQVTHCAILDDATLMNKFKFTLTGKTAEERQKGDVTSPAIIYSVAANTSKSWESMVRDMVSGTVTWFVYCV